jgi:curved DNA-binding protein CbpA
VPAPLVPDDDLYARLEVASDASPEAIELAWRALLKLHHPDVAGDGAEALDRAKRINVAHDWLSDRDLRVRYDLDRAGPALSSPGSAAASGRGRRGHGERIVHAPWRRRTPAPPPRPDLFRGDPNERLAWFLARVERLTPDELDRLTAAEPPPIAFLATVRRFITPQAQASFAAAETAIAARVPADRWAGAGCREGLLGVAAELVLAAFLDDMLAEPFRGRARERLLRAWDASVDQPRYGPHGADVATLRDRVAGLTRDQLAAFLRASQGVDAGTRPWPETLDPEEDEALRISALLAARDVAAATPVDGVPRPSATRARRLAGRLGHVTALRHAFPAATYAAFVAPLVVAAGLDAAPAAEVAPGVRRAR